jgi:hypothetical protein
MITVKRCATIGQATTLKCLLEGSGIPAFIPDDYCAGIAPYFFATKAGIRIQVSEEDEDRARILLLADESGSADPDLGSES